MTPTRELVLRRMLWSGAIVVASASVGAGILALLESGRVHSFSLGAVYSSTGDTGGTKDRAGEIDLLRAKKMSRAIVKAVPPPSSPPPKPPVPPLDTLIRLSGIMSFGRDAPKEAFIELRSANQTKAYKAGDVLSPAGITIKSITDVVILQYDEKAWKLTDRGVEALPVAPLSGPGLKN